MEHRSHDDWPGQLFALADSRVQVLRLQVGGEERSGCREAEMDLGQRRDLDQALLDDEVENVPAPRTVVAEEVQVIPGHGDALLVVRGANPRTTPLRSAYVC